MDGRHTYNGVQPGSPRGLYTTLLLVPQCHAAFGRISSTLAWEDQSPVSQCVLQYCLQGIPSTPDATSHVTQGMDCQCVRVTPPHLSPSILNAEVWMRGWIYGRPVCSLTQFMDEINARCQYIFSHSAVNSI